MQIKLSEFSTISPCTHKYVSARVHTYTHGCAWAVGGFPFCVHTCECSGLERERGSLNPFYITFLLYWQMPNTPMCLNSRILTLQTQNSHIKYCHLTLATLQT